MIKYIIITLVIVTLLLFTMAIYYGSQLGRIKEEIIHNEKKIKDIYKD